MKQPTMLPAVLRDAMATAAVKGVQDADYLFSGRSGDERRRAARLITMGTLHSALVLDKIPELGAVGTLKARQGLGVLIDAAEDVTHGVVGEITDAGIAAAQRATHCACGPTFVAILKALLDIAVQGAFAGIRAATK